MLVIKRKKGERVRVKTASNHEFWITVHKVFSDKAVELGFDGDIHVLREELLPKGERR